MDGVEIGIGTLKRTDGISIHSYPICTRTKRPLRKIAQEDITETMMVETIAEHIATLTP